MADQRDGGIPWCEETWNCLRGCTPVSPGCARCYAERQAARMAHGAYKGLVVLRDDGPPRWTGVVRLVEEKLLLPLRWRRPRMVFVNSMSDMFHENLTQETIDRVLVVMAVADRHVYQVLTKRADRMRAYLSGVAAREDLASRVYEAGTANGLSAAEIATAFERLRAGPLPWVWWGVSVENQRFANLRVAELLGTPAVVRWVSYEPALGPVALGRIKRADGFEIDALRGVYERRHGGGDPEEWPLDLRVRQFPATPAGALR